MIRIWPPNLRQTLNRSNNLNVTPFAMLFEYWVWAFKAPTWRLWVLIKHPFINQTTSFLNIPTVTQHPPRVPCNLFLTYNPNFFHLPPPSLLLGHVSSLLDWFPWPWLPKPHTLLLGPHWIPPSLLERKDHHLFPNNHIISPQEWHCLPLGNTINSSLSTTSSLSRHVINFAPRITSLLPTENINISSPSTSPSFYCGNFPKSCSRHQARSLQSLPQKTQHSHVNGELEATSYSPRKITNNSPRRQ